MPDDDLDWYRITTPEELQQELGEGWRVTPDRTVQHQSGLVDVVRHIDGYFAARPLSAQVRWPSDLWAKGGSPKRALENLQMRLERVLLSGFQTYLALGGSPSGALTDIAKLVDFVRAADARDAAKEGPDGGPPVRDDQDFERWFLVRQRYTRARREVAHLIPQPHNEPEKPDGE